MNKKLKTILLLSPLFFLLHNFEEALTMYRFIQTHLDRLPAPIRLLETTLQLTQFGFTTSIVVITLLFAAISLAAVSSSSPRWVRGMWGILMAALCANAVLHIAQGLWFWGYTPGLITALLLQLPLTLLALVESVKNGVFTRRAAITWFLLGFPIVVFLSIAFLFLGKWLTLLF
jgi:hypothetical protein